MNVLIAFGDNGQAEQLNFKKVLSNLNSPHYHQKSLTWEIITVLTPRHQSRYYHETFH